MVSVRDQHEEESVYCVRHASDAGLVAELLVRDGGDGAFIQHPDGLQKVRLQNVWLKRIMSQHLLKPAIYHRRQSRESRW